jgi:general secretion pathway protein K
MTGLVRNDRGVALLIAILVMTLLLALIFEFAYGTRVSLRAAVNFRDSQRADLLVRSGVNLAGRLLADNLKRGKRQDNLEQREWQVMPIGSAGDAELRVRWEDEAGKINIVNLSAGQPSLVRLERLFGLKRVDLEVLDRLREQRVLRMTGELHRFMKDVDFEKVRESVTVFGSDSININTASSDVLQSLGISEAQASMIIEGRKSEPFPAKDRVPGISGIDPITSSRFVFTSDVFLVQSHATVGGYTKQAEAVIRRNAGGFTILYWRIL